MADPLTAGVLVVTLAAALVGLMATPSAGADTECAPVLGRVVVAVVVDDGQAVSSTCVDVDPGSKGSDALQRRAERLGVPAPRYDASGLLCAIDGYPATGCGQADGSGAFLYWSYWWGGDAGWRYASTGPATRRLTDGSVEGWHFIRGKTTGTDNAPRTDAGFRWGVPATVPSGGRPPGGGAPAVVTPSVGAPTPAPATPRGAPRAGATPPPPTAAPAPLATAAPADTPPDAPPASPVTPAEAPGTASDDPPTSTTAVGSGGVPVEVESATRTRPSAAREVDQGGVGWLPTILGIGAVGAVGGITIARRRKRAAP